jgi:hypothetical protein
MYAAKVVIHIMKRNRVYVGSCTTEFGEIGERIFVRRLCRLAGAEKLFEKLFQPRKRLGEGSQT